MRLVLVLVVVIAGCRGESSPLCGPPRATKHGRVQLTGQTEGERVYYSCSYGFALLGSSFAECRADGTWSENPPKCIGRRCPSLPYLRHGSMMYSYGRGMVVFKCMDGFTLSGEPELICEDGRNWNGSMPTCQEGNQSVEFTTRPLLLSDEEKNHDDWMQDSDYSCVGPEGAVPIPQVANATGSVHWVMVDGEARLYAVYRCNWEYVLEEGVRNMYCQSGKWVGILPACKLFFTETKEKVLATNKDGGNSTSTQRDEIAQDPQLTTHARMLLQADYTCLDGNNSEVAPPGIYFARAHLRFKNLEGQPRLYVQYKCSRISRMVDGQIPFMYCVNGSWIGHTPQCIPKGQVIVQTTLAPDPCLVNNGGCQHHCTNDGGEAKCGCRAGSRPRGRSGRRCQDINECRDFNGRCAHICTNTKGSYTCSCHKGFTVHVDRHSCIMDSHAYHVNNRRTSKEKLPPYVLFH